MLLFNIGTLEPVVNPMAKNLPTPGRYYSEIVDVTTEIVVSLEGTEDFCLVLQHRLLGVDSGTEHNFVETYNTLKSNARINSLQEYLVEHGYDTTCDHLLVGIRELVDITYEYLGGFCYPMIYRRTFIGKVKD